MAKSVILHYPSLPRMTGFTFTSIVMLLYFHAHYKTMTLKLPEWMLDGKYSWLTEEYIIEHGKYPEKPDVVDTIDEDKRTKELYFGEIPLISTDDIEEGDILVFFDGDGEDIFYRFNEDDIAEYRNEERGFLAHGVIIKPPVTGDEA